MLLLARVVLLAAVLTVATVVQGGPGFQAQTLDGISLRGISSEGISSEGISLRGISLQGISLQGISLQAMTLNGLTLQGIRVQGVGLQGTQLVGNIAGEIQALPASTTLSGLLADGRSVTLRIDRVEQDLSQNLFEIDAYRGNLDIHLYTLSYRDDGDSAWRAVCAGDTKAIFLEGAWDPSGARISEASSALFTVSCTNGVLAKCARVWGYKPWASVRIKNKETILLRDLHQACVRAARADYCGDGTPHTRDGTLIDLWDAYGLVTKVPEKQSGAGFSTEASFGTDGAGCIERPRYDEYRPDCTLPGLQDLKNSTSKSRAANTDDRTSCVNRQNATGNTQLIFTESSTYCPHSPTVVGAGLNRDCNACTRKVCGKHEYCCGMAADRPAIWDETCVKRAKKVCR